MSKPNLYSVLCQTFLYNYSLKPYRTQVHMKFNRLYIYNKYIVYLHPSNACNYLKFDYEKTIVCVII